MVTRHSLADQLQQNGYLTAHQLVKYLAENFPTRKVSYPTMLRYVAKGYLVGTQVGGQFRLSKASIENYLKYGTDPEAMTEEEGATQPSLSSVETSKVVDPEPTLPEPEEVEEEEVEVEDPRTVGLVPRDRNLDKIIPVTFGDGDDTSE